MRDRMVKKRKKHEEPTVAPGMNDHELLDQEATQSEIERGEYTEVTHLSYDEVEQSEG